MNESSTWNKKLSPIVQTTIDYDKFGNIISINTGTGAPYNVLEGRARSGQSLASYRRIIKSGGNATTPFQGTAFELLSVASSDVNLIKRHPDGWVERTENYVGENIFHIDPVFLGDPSSDLTTADNQAKVNGYRRLGDVHTSFQGGIFLGELRESLTMMNDRGKKIFNGVTDFLGRAAKVARTVKKKHRIKRLAEDWLEYSFGWAPLANDISQAVKAYKRHIAKPIITRITSTGKDVQSPFEDPSGDSIGSIGFIKYVSVRDTTTVRYIMGLRTTTQGVQPNETAERFGLVTSQFLPTAWELLPWSFLVDYFTNIGDIINAGATSTRDVIWTCKTIRTERLRIVTAVLMPPPPLTYTFGSLGTCIARKKSVSRSSAGLSLPEFQVSIPGKVTQWLNMGALAATRGRVQNAFSTPKT